ncbi:MAG TPA: hypothetical protein V6C82_04485 [Chroococcales cyanobacterium]
MSEINNSTGPLFKPVLRKNVGVPKPADAPDGTALASSNKASAVNLPIDEIVISKPPVYKIAPPPKPLVDNPGSGPKPPNTSRGIPGGSRRGPAHGE